jgi:hypothetical protein
MTFDKREKALQFLHSVDGASRDGDFRRKLSARTVVWEMTVEQLVIVYGVTKTDAEDVVNTFLATDGNKQG